MKEMESQEKTISSSNPQKQRKSSISKHLETSLAGHNGEVPCIWEERRDKATHALEEITKIEKILDGMEVQSLKALREELTNMSELYTFYMHTQSLVTSSDLGYFSVLPTEVIMLILSHLKVKSLCKVLSVCKEFKNLGEDESLWQSICKKIGFHEVERPERKSWKWLAQVKTRKFKDEEFKDGPGTYYYKVDEEHNKRNRYTGDWKNNKRHGYGTFFWAESSYYAGRWKDDQREGKGIRVWPNGNKYVGQYKSHKRHGHGEFTFSNGSIFRGKFEDNKFVSGTYTWPNGRIYTGDWNNVHRHGDGHYSWPDGRTYEGEWRNDKRHGHGVYTWPDGDVFEGEFSDGRRYGKGKLKCANGDKYSQIWREEKFEEFNKGIESSNEVTSTKMIDSVSKSNKGDKRKTENGATEKNIISNNNNNINNREVAKMNKRKNGYEFSSTTTPKSKSRRRGSGEESSESEEMDESCSAEDDGEGSDEEDRPLKKKR